MSEFLQKLLSRAKEKADSLEAEPVDNLLSTDGLSALDFEPPSNIEAPPQFEPPSNIEAGGIKITNNYMRFDLDIFDAIKAMSESETRIYLDLLLRSYGQIPARNICNTTNPEIASRTGIGSSSSFSKAIRSLEQRGYIKRIFESHQKNQKSIYRVYLPCELTGSRSKTKIENIS
jgi:DNA-binding MarR family transcriptional regulator